ncbi:MAG: cupredoxin family copper-binding protein [Candidatus Acidiferrum sp.]
MNWYRNLACVAFVVSSGMAVAAATKSAPGTEPNAPAASAIDVKIDNFTFAPGTITVPKGTTVNWTNRDDIPHTVVAEDKSTFKSKALDTDDKFSYTFDKSGTYSYFCSLHPKMTAKVVVQ